MKSFIDNLKGDRRELVHKKALPKWARPMLARLTHDRFSDANWIYERKLDGERCLVFGRGNRVDLLSRNRKNLNRSYPELAKAFRDQDISRFIVDGEIVAFEGNLTSFSRLQQRMQTSRKSKTASNVGVYFYMFDLLYLDKYDLTRLDLRSRKKLLKDAFNFGNKLRFTAHRNRNGVKYAREACRKGWEGLIAKDAESRYVHGRSSKWLKFKCVNQQEFVIGGFTEPEGERIGFGALLIGYYESGKLIFAGKVGTGYDDDMLRSLGARLEKLERKKSAFANNDIDTQGVHWVTPKLVGEVGFTEWTEGGKLRHPRFLGLRRDKKAKDVKREN